MKKLTPIIAFVIISFFVQHPKAFALDGGKENSKHAADTARSGTALLSAAKPAVQSTSLIEKMTDEQLVNLIDLLFEVDSVPADLVQEITRVVNNRTKIKSEILPVTENLPPVIPAENYDSLLFSPDLYVNWDEKHTFTVKQGLTKNDTSIVLELLTDKYCTFTMPIEGVVTSNFGWRDSTFHRGVDVDLNKGDAVKCAFDGKVRFAKREGGYGNVVVVRHYNGLETVYAHLWKIKVKAEQVVKSGDVIGLGGMTGHATGTHLHFEMRYKGEAINPKYVISFKQNELLGFSIVLKKTKWGIAAYPENAKMHTIERGDSLFEIAKRYATTTAKLRELNDFPKRPRLYVGQKIRVS